MRKFAAVAAVLAVVSISACKKTGDGEYQVEKPVVGTQTDTIHTPTVDVGTDTATVTDISTYLGNCSASSKSMSSTWTARALRSAT